MNLVPWLFIGLIIVFLSEGLLWVCGGFFSNFFSRHERLIYISFMNMMPLQHISNTRVSIPEFRPQSIILNSCIVKDRAVYMMTKGWADGQIKDPGTKMKSQMNHKKMGNMPSS